MYVYMTRIIVVFFYNINPFVCAKICPAAGEGRAEVRCTLSSSLRIFNMQFSLCKILFHITALVWESVILLLPPRTCKAYPISILSAHRVGLGVSWLLWLYRGSTRRSRGSHDPHSFGIFFLRKQNAWAEQWQRAAGQSVYVKQSQRYNLLYVVPDRRKRGTGATKWK